MNRRVQVASRDEGSDETVLLPVAQPPDAAKVCCLKRELGSIRGPELSKETQTLLRLRLRASALILLVGFGVFLLRHLVGALTDDLFKLWLLAFHILVVLVEGVLAFRLSRQRIDSTRRLRVAEIVIFGLPGAFFLALQHQSTLFDVARGFMPPPSPTWLLLIFTYAMFIPNSWRRAALVIGAMSLAPLLLTTAMVLGYPAVARVISLGDIVQHVLTLVIAAVAAVFGTQLINALRREAFEARQPEQYRLIERLGAGGMGEVYLAEHRMLKRPCAIKLIRPDQAGNPQALARFEREVRMTAGLSHWNTIEIFDYGRTEDGTFYYVMEYLPGLSLETLLDRHGPLPAERVIHFLRQVCGGLREAHSIGLIHRDIKPGNIFAAQRGGLYDVAKLLDFGLVKSVAEQSSKRLTHEGAISGTPLFMSPEQAQGLPGVDARSDIYSLGAVGYALLTGRPPFEAPSAMEVIVAHARDEVTPPSLLQDDVPSDLEGVILRCLAKRPEDRFQDAECLEQALAECGSANRWTQSHAVRWWNESRRQVVQPEEARMAPVH